MTIKPRAPLTPLQALVILVAIVAISVLLGGCAAATGPGSPLRAGEPLTCAVLKVGKIAGHPAFEFICAQKREEEPS